jgi:hypothetical protein
MKKLPKKLAELFPDSSKKTSGENVLFHRKNSSV